MCNIKKHLAEIESEIFREYDIRGIIDKQLTEETFELIGKAFGTFLKTGTITVGGDVRTTTPKFKEAFITGILSTGINVIDLGIVPTPTLYYSIIKLKTDGGVEITASHNPKEYNGLKLSLKNAVSLYGEQIQKLKTTIDSGNFQEGKGKLKQKDIVSEYIVDIISRTKIGRKLRVVVDAGNGTASIIVPKLFEKLDIDAELLYCEPDGNFPNHLPDPTKPELLKDLIAKVKENKADLGIGYDGDGDRIGAVDEKGRIIWGDKLLALLSREILKENPGSKIIFEVKCSEALEEDIKKHGGVPLMWKTGHSLIKAKMKKENAAIAGEMSGHIFFSHGYYGFDDALFASLKLIEMVSNQDKSLSEIADSLAEYPITPEIRIDCPDARKFDIVEEAKELLREKAKKIIDIDGVRAVFEDGWGLIRASNTSPKLIVRAEAKSEEALAKINEILSNTLRELGIEAKI